MNTKKLKSIMLRQLMALFVVLFAFNMTACDDDDNGGDSGDKTNSISGTLTFTYNGAPIDSAHWPHSSSTSDSIPGYFRIALMPANPDGMATGGPVDGLPALGHGTGIEFSGLTNGKWNYKFEGIADGTYLIAPTYENILDPNGFRKTVGIGHWGDPTKWNFGTPVTVSGGAVENVDMICDVAAGINMAHAIKRSSNPDTTNAGTICGTLTVDNVSKWPTGGKFIGLVGYKHLDNKDSVIARFTANPFDPEAAPSIYQMISAPTEPGVNMIAFVDSTGFSFGPQPGVSFGDYKLLLVDIFEPTGAFSYPNDPPLDTYISNQDKKSFTLDGANPMLFWHADVTLP